MKVTNLNDSGPGSFRDAIENARGPRTIVFEVGGVIEAQTQVTIPTDDADITIAGQTAPGGITLSGAALAQQYVSSAYNVMTNMILRHMRFRGVHRDNSGGDYGTNPLRMYKSNKVMLDYISVSWGCDQLLDFTHTDELSMQYAILANAACTPEPGETPDGGGCSHPEGQHNLGHIAGYTKMTNHSYHKSFFANNKGRNPFINARQTNTRPQVDMRNLVGFNANINIHALNDADVNLVGCYYKDGDDASNPNFFYLTENPAAYIEDAYYQGAFVDSYTPQGSSL